MSRLVIESGRAESLYWHDLWRYRELFHVLAWRDLSVKYKQTAVGILWALIPPFINMVVLTIVFGRLAKVPSDGVPYPLFSFAGLLPWSFFAAALANSGQSLVSNANLISKIYFPRLIIPASSVVTAFVDFLISFVLMAGAMVWYQFWPGWHLVALPGMILLAFCAVLGPGLLITSLNVRYRDFRFILPFIPQFGIFISPVGYSSAAIGEKWRLLYSLNPMVGVIDGFRWTLLGARAPLYLPGFFLSLAVSAGLLVLGIWYFRRTERTFADII